MMEAQPELRAFHQVFHHLGVLPMSLPMIKEYRQTVGATNGMFSCEV
jgi:hypothetical protein